MLKQPQMSLEGGCNIDLDRKLSLLLAIYEHEGKDQSAQYDRLFTRYSRMHMLRRKGTDYTTQSDSRSRISLFALPYLP